MAIVIIMKNGENGEIICQTIMAIMAKIIWKRNNNEIMKTAMKTAIMACRNNNVIIIIIIIIIM
jgi:hypothetical protein